ncbi:hypothetical protein ACFLQ8_02300 [Candidatus Auribacterota bacterium]
MEHKALKTLISILFITTFLIQSNSVSLALAPSTEMPDLKNAKVVKIEGKTLIITEKALGKMDELDKIIRRRTGTDTMPSEIGGIGLTKKIGKDVTLVVDFVEPRKDKIFEIKSRSLIVSSEIANLMLAVAASSKLALTLRNNELFFDSDVKESSFTIDDYEWRRLQDLVIRLCRKGLPDDVKELKSKIKESGPIELDIDWDIVITGVNAMMSKEYLDRVFEEAKKQGAIPDFMMHYHPQLAMPGLVLDGTFTTEEILSDILTFSAGDLQAFKVRNVNWFEVRTLGIPDRQNKYTDTVGRFYSYEQIKTIGSPLKGIIQSIIDLRDEEATPERLYALVEEITVILEKFKSMTGHKRVVISVLEHYLGAELIGKVRQILMERDRDGLIDIIDIVRGRKILISEGQELFAKLSGMKKAVSLKEFVLANVLFCEGTDMLSPKPEVIDLELLKLHESLGIYSLCRKARDYCVSNPLFKKRILELFDREDLWNLSSETDKEKIKSGAEVLSALLDYLPYIVQEGSTDEGIYADNIFESGA